MAEPEPLTLKLWHPSRSIKSYPWFSCDLGYLSIGFHPRIESDVNGPHVVCMDVSTEALIIKEEDRHRLYDLSNEKNFLMETFFAVVILDNVDFPYPKCIFAEMLDLDITDSERRIIQKHLDGFTCLYLIRDNDTGLTKIGRSDDPEQRLKTLIKQDTLMPSPNNFTLLRAWDDYPYNERGLHQHFATKRVRGEWFDLTDEDIKEALAYCYIYD